MTVMTVCRIGIYLVSSQLESNHLHLSIISDISELRNLMTLLGRNTPPPPPPPDTTSEGDEEYSVEGKREEKEEARLKAIIASVDADGDSQIDLDEVMVVVVSPSHRHTVTPSHRRDDDVTCTYDVAQKGDDDDDDLVSSPPRFIVRSRTAMLPCILYPGRSTSTSSSPSSHKDDLVS